MLRLIIVMPYCTAGCIFIAFDRGKIQDKAWLWNSCTAWRSHVSHPWFNQALVWLFCNPKPLVRSCPFSIFPLSTLLASSLRGQSVGNGSNKKFSGCMKPHWDLQSVAGLLNTRNCLICPSRATESLGGESCKTEQNKSKHFTSSSSLNVPQSHNESIASGWNF